MSLGSWFPSIFKSSNDLWSLSHITLFWHRFSAFLFHFWGAGDDMGPTWIIQNNLPPKVSWLATLIPSATLIHSCHRIYHHRFWRLGRGHLYCYSAFNKFLYRFEETCPVFPLAPWKLVSLNSPYQHGEAEWSRGQEGGAWELPGSSQSPVFSIHEKAGRPGRSLAVGTK